MEQISIQIEGIPAVLWGAPSSRAILAVHGSQSSKTDTPILLLAQTAAARGWQVLSFERLEKEYDRLSWECGVQPKRTLYNCLQRLMTRGLVASGAGDTDFEAVYDLIGSLYVAPLSESLPLRLATFVKLVICRGIPLSRAMELFRKDRPNAVEARVMALARQELLSTAELVKCEELGVKDVSTSEKLMAALYNDDDSTSDNMPARMQASKSVESVTMAVANLYLRKRIIFERV